MNDQWGSRRPSGTDTGISQVLEIYAARGGRLEGARRWPQNPLTLTHVRWMSEYGEAVEAFCPPEDGASVSEDERKVWVDLALEFSAMHPNPVGLGANWAPLPIGQERAVELSQRIALHGLSGARSNYSPVDYSAPSPFGPTPRLDAYNPFSSPTTGLPGFGSGQVSPSRPLRPSGVTPPPYPGSYNSGFEGYSDEPPSYGGASGASGSYQQTDLYGAETSVFPCVEVELPTAIMGSTVDAYTRAFANDVARNFNHAVRTIPQARETRGWMRAGRLVLAARFSLGQSGRPPGQLEMDASIQMLRDALARYTLTYSAIGHADLGAWSQQGQPLPD
jgi:hypothetical protein